MVQRASPKTGIIYLGCLTFFVFCAVLHDSLVSDQLIERRSTEALIEEKMSQVLIHCFCEMNSIPADEILRILADGCAR